jgi:hypothetical protein
MDAISAMILTANRKTFSVENIFCDVGARIAGDFVEGPSSKVQSPRLHPALIALSTTTRPSVV